MFSKCINTRGNSNEGALNQAHQKKSKINYDPPVKEISDMEILNELEKTAHCCGYGGSIGCIRKTFSAVTDDGLFDLDIITAIQIVRICRKTTNWRDQENLDQYSEQLFRSCIDKKIETKRGVKFLMDYRIEQGKYPVCKKSFSCAYGISEYKLESISSRIKECGDGSAVFKVAHKAFSDHTIYNFNYVETESLFAANLLCSECSVGTNINCIL
jgi:hypothetical protein